VEDADPPVSPTHYIPGLEAFSDVLVFVLVLRLAVLKLVLLGSRCCHRPIIQLQKTRALTFFDNDDDDDYDVTDDDDNNSDDHDNKKTAQVFP